MIMRFPLLVCSCLLGVSSAWAALELSLDLDTTANQELESLSASLPAHSAELDPELRRCSTLVQQRRFLDALAILRDKIRREPDNVEARFMAVSAFVGIGRYQAAETLLEQMMDKHPDNPGLLNNLAWIYATSDSPPMRDPPRAVELARRALMLSPMSYHIWSTLAEAHFANRDYPRSLRAAEEALRLCVEDNAPPAQRISYERQVVKCREAVLAFSIIE